MKQRKDYILPVSVFMLVTVILSCLFLMIERKSVQENQIRFQYMAANQANIMSSAMDSALSRAYTLKVLVDDNDGDLTFFDKEAETIYLDATENAGIVLKNLAVAPNGIVEKVYPLSGNESLVGFDFMDVTRPGNEEAVEAYRLDRMVVTNPFPLVQGGTGIAGRLPIFLERDGQRIFWGLVTMTIDYDRLLEGFRLDTLTDMGVNYELWYSGADGNRVPLAASATLPKAPVSYEFAIHDLIWHLDLTPANGWYNYIELIAGFAIILATALMIFLLMVDKAKLRLANETLERLATMDSLTMCYSRHYVNTILVNQRSGRWNNPLAKYSLALVDIDKFKSINDTYGHEAGDRAIVAVAQVLIDHAKQASGDCVVRHGGDEFVLLFNDVTPERFRDKLNSIVEGVRAIRFTDYPDMRLSVSIGGEYFTSPEQSLYYDMILAADKKLYDAKEHGRDQFQV